MSENTQNSETLTTLDGYKQQRSVIKTIMHGNVGRAAEGWRSAGTADVGKYFFS